MLSLPAFPSLENIIFEQLDENNGKSIQKSLPRKKPTDQFANYEMNLFKMKNAIKDKKLSKETRDRFKSILRSVEMTQQAMNT